jgi:hypothetical protein
MSEATLGVGAPPEHTTPPDQAGGMSANSQDIGVRDTSIPQSPPTETLASGTDVQEATTLIANAGTDNDNPALSTRPSREQIRNGESENPKDRLITKEQQAKDLDTVEAKVWQLKIKRALAQEKKDGLPPGIAKMREIDTVLAQPDGNYTKPITLDGSDAFRWSFSGQSIVGGEVVLEGKCIAITGAQGGDFTCEIELDDGSFKTTTISRADVQAQLTLANADLILQNFSGAEKDLMKLYMEGLKNDSSLPEPGTEESKKINETITKVAREVGMPTRDDLIAFTENIGGLSDDEKQTIIDLTDGNILSFESFDKAMRNSDLSPDALTKRLDKLQDRLEEYQKIPDNQRSSDVKKAIKDMESQIHMLSEVKKLYNGPLEQFFTKLQSGEIPPETAKEFIDTFRGGQITEEAFQKFGEQFPGLQRQPGESLAEWKARVKTGVGTLGLVALIFLLASSQVAQTIGASAPASGH